VTNAQQTETKRCTLCPAGCELIVLEDGPDNWRTELPAQNVGGLCPRGAILGQLLAHRKRLTFPAQRANGTLGEVDLDGAVKTILAAAGDGAITFFLDGNVPVEEMTAVSAWCGAWDRATLCLVIEPSDEAVLSGVAASGAAMLSNADLAGCDGFLIVGDAFSANPTCARPVFDRRAEEARTPIVVIDSAAGRTTKFASLPVTTPAGMEYQVLAEVAKAAGVEVAAAGKAATAVAAGKALAGCRRLGVILSAEYGRSAAWKQIGFLAGTMAKQFGGGVAVETTGANALAAVGLAGKLGAISLAEALSGDSTRVALGCDVLGMLGISEPKFAAAAAAFANRTTESADVILPVALSGEIGGSTWFVGKGMVSVPALLAPPAGTLVPSDVVAALAKSAGIAEPTIPTAAKELGAIEAEAPGEAPAAPEVGAPALLIGREAMHSGCGDLTGYGSWQQGDRPQSVLRISPADMTDAGLKNEAIVRIQTGDASVEVKVQVSPELTPGAVVISDGAAAVRALLPSAAGAALPQKVTLIS